jgi:hypothetical protein
MGRILATISGSCSMPYPVPSPHHYFGPTNVTPQPSDLHHVPAPLAVYPLPEFWPTLLTPSPPNPSLTSVSSRTPIMVDAKPMAPISGLLVIIPPLYPSLASTGPWSQSPPRSFLPLSHRPLSYQTFPSPACRRLISSSPPHLRFSFGFFLSHEFGHDTIGFDSDVCPLPPFLSYSSTSKFNLSFTSSTSSTYATTNCRYRYVPSLVP